jgi:adenosylhomocysteine nucleosidase
MIAVMPGLRVMVLTAIEMEAKAVRGMLPTGADVRAIGINGSRLRTIGECAAEVVIIAGLGGALDPSLGVGDVVLDDRGGLVAGLVELRRGRIHTAGRIVSSVQEKASLFRATGALAVDMEQSLVQSMAEQHAMRWLGVRAVSDTAQEALDPAMLGFVDDLGRPKPAAIAIGLLRRPALVGQLRRLEKSAAIALDRLGTAVREIMVAIKPDAG